MHVLAFSFSAAEHESLHAKAKEHSKSAFKGKGSSPPGQVGQVKAAVYNLRIT